MKVLLLFMLVLLNGCSDTNFRKVEKLDGFKIIAIESNVPEVAPGGAATLRLFVSDPTGGGRIINGSAVTCIDPGISLGAAVSCAHDPTRVVSAYTINTTVADLANNLFTGYSGSLNLTVPNTIFAGRSDREKNNGVGYIAIFSFTVDGKETTAFKRVMATNRAGLNSNPTGTAILLNGAAFAGNPQEGDRLNLTTSVPETYNYINVDGSIETRIEDMEVAWYISDGAFNRPKADLGQEVKLTESPPPAPYLLIGIVRDDRGGVEVVRIKVL